MARKHVGGVAALERVSRGRSPAAASAWRSRYIPSLTRARSSSSPLTAGEIVMILKVQSRSFAKEAAVSSARRASTLPSRRLPRSQPRVVRLGKPGGAIATGHGAWVISRSARVPGTTVSSPLACVRPRTISDAFSRSASSRSPDSGPRSGRSAGGGSRRVRPPSRHALGQSDPSDRCRRRGGRAAAPRERRRDHEIGAERAREGRGQTAASRDASRPPAPAMMTLSRLSLDKAMLKRIGDELRPVGDSGLSLDVRSVGLDRANAEHELLRDLGFMYPCARRPSTSLSRGVSWSGGPRRQVGPRSARPAQG